MGLTLVVQLGALHSDGEDGVGARRVLVHVGLADMAVHVTLQEHLHHVFGLLDDERGQVLHVHTRVLVSEVQTGALFVQQVANILIVDFQIRHSHQVLLLCVTLNLGEDIFEGARHDTLVLVILGHTGDGEGLAGTSLAIGEDSSIVALDDIFANWESRLCKNFLLLRVPVVDGVEGENFGDLFSGLRAEDFSSLLEHLDGALATISDFCIRHRSASDNDADALRFADSLLCLCHCFKRD
mmetsp:Transcript_22823/g.28284  ORF Transcript_22823/g.28284 Transcript_22823/m.28284 type:complete len:240 (-) Transcript_22823:7-726(-)